MDLAPSASLEPWPPLLNEEPRRRLQREGKQNVHILPWTLAQPVPSLGTCSSGFLFPCIQVKTSEERWPAVLKLEAARDTNPVLRRWPPEGQQDLLLFPSSPPIPHPMQLFLEKTWWHLHPWKGTESSDRRHFPLWPVMSTTTQLSPQGRLQLRD